MGSYSLMYYNDIKSVDLTRVLIGSVAKKPGCATSRRGCERSVIQHTDQHVFVSYAYATADNAIGYCCHCQRGNSS